MFLNPDIVNALTTRDHELHQSVCELTHRASVYMSAHSEKEYIMNCHSITRAIASRMPDLRVVSGRHVSIKYETAKQVFVTYTIHSWLATPDDAVIDAYPPTILSIAPIIVPTKGKYAEANAGMYIADSSVEGFMRKHVNTWRMRHFTARVIQLIADAEDFAKSNA